MASGVKFSRGELVKSTKAQDFHLSHKFGLEVDAITVNGVHSIENIALEFEIVEYADGEDKTPHCRPGINHPGQVTIRRDGEVPRVRPGEDALPGARASCPHGVPLPIQ